MELWRGRIGAPPLPRLIVKVATRLSQCSAVPCQVFECFEVSLSVLLGVCRSGGGFQQALLLLIGGFALALLVGFPLLRGSREEPAVNLVPLLAKLEDWAIVWPGEVAARWFKKAKETAPSDGDTTGLVGATIEYVEFIQDYGSSSNLNPNARPFVPSPGLGPTAGPVTPPPMETQGAAFASARGVR